MAALQDAWWNRFGGIPFKDLGMDPVQDGGLNCWGLGRWVYMQELGMLLPTYMETVDEQARLSAQLGTLDVAFTSGVSTWVSVAAGQHKQFDLVLLRRGRLVCHVGLVAKPRQGLMLHVEEGGVSCLESYVSGHWARRVVGVYRHA